MRNFEQWFNMRGSYEISTSSVLLNLMKSNNILRTQRFFILTEYREVIVKKLTAHYAYRNANLNLILFAAKLRDSTVESFVNGIVGVCLPWFDCITIFFCIFCKGIIFGSNCGANWTLSAQWNNFFQDRLTMYRMYWAQGYKTNNMNNKE